jgi:hypothetical protein
MLEGILARMMDAVLPFVAGRKLVVVEEVIADAFAAWTDESAEQCAAVISAATPDDLRIKLSGVDLPAGTIVAVVQAASTEPVVPPAWKIVDVQYTFPDTDGIAEQRAEPSLPADERWPASRNAGGVWLDVEKPDKHLACLVIAQVGG